MRFRSCAVLALLAVLSPVSALAANCEGDSTGLVPLTDLGTGLYQGFTGGLYGGGANARPPAHDAAGLAIAHAIAPLDTFGQPDPAGRIVLISIGMSNTTQEFAPFVTKAMALATRHPALRVVDCAQGGQPANTIRNPNAAYWNVVDARLRQTGASPAQVQVAWIKQANSGPTGAFVPSASQLTSNLAAIVRILKDRYPNVRLAYLSSRIYAGYATTALNPEPYAYESGFAVRWLIEQQLAGVDSLNFDPAAGTVESPWLAWGPYLWADGMEGRGDGLAWPCDFFAADGTHPATGARALVSDSLLAFFSADATTVPWFLNGATAAVAPRAPSLALALAPNPAAGAVEARFAGAPGAEWRLDVHDAQGRRVRALARGRAGGGWDIVRWNGMDDRGAPVAAGLYWLRLTTPAGAASRRLAWLGH